MKKYYLITLILLINGVYNSLVVSQTSNQKPLENALTLELKFGDENLPNEYLLVQPIALAVNDMGDIFVSDEKRIKVFDKAGKEKTLIGRSGQGPGEFSSNPRLWINPDGSITATNTGGFNLYDKQYKFIEKKQTSSAQSKYMNIATSHGWMGISEEQFIPLSNKSTLIVGSGVESLRGKDPDILLYVYTELLIEKPDTVIELGFYRDTRFYQYKSAGISLYFKGELLWSMESDKYLAFCHPDFDITQQNKTYQYAIHVVSLKDLNRRKITLQYSPVEIPDSVKDSHFARFKALEEMSLTLYPPKKIIDMVKDTQYYPPLQRVFADGGIVVALTFQRNKKGEFVADIFDIVSGGYLRSAYFCDVPDVIKNGYAYRLYTPKDGYPVVEKYRIDPRVYGK